MIAVLFWGVVGVACVGTLLTLGLVLAPFPTVFLIVAFCLWSWRTGQRMTR
jgi:hypothetical protein